MLYRYDEWDGSEFPTQDKLELAGQVLDFILQYGDSALQALEESSDEGEIGKLIQSLIDEGLLEKVKGRFRLTPRAVNAMQRKALMEIFSNLKRGGRDGHQTLHAGASSERLEGTKPYQFGDPVSELDLSATLRNAIHRNGAGLPIKISEGDFELHLSEGQTSCSICILLDMSGSMQRYGRFFQAKKVAMSMYALVQQRFPQDTLDIVGFYSTASQIEESKLPLLMPKQVETFDPVVRQRVTLKNADKAPQHFTNLQMGLMMARRILRRRGGENRQVFIITDGQPTAHVQGDYLYLLYPPDKTTTAATLKEALTCTKENIRISTFALIEDYYYMDWVGFVDQLTKLTQGVAFYCTSGDLADCIMESYLSGRRKKTYIA
jgi:uncharacterized protein with von Willebrand factor type A (vWA) domain